MLCALRHPAAPTGPGSAIPLLSVPRWLDLAILIGLLVPGEAADSLVGASGDAVLLVPG